MKVEHIGDATLYLADCREVLTTLDEHIDVVISDPPYGVEFKGKTTTNSNVTYASYDDSEENFRAIVLPAVSTAIGLSDRAAIFTGVRRLHEYPTPRDIGGVICPAGAGMSPWGFGCYNPVLFYGSSPYLQAALGSRPTAVVINPNTHRTKENKIDHPCPKPIAFMLWLVETASLPGQVVLDPFMGSGTTGVAAMKLRRKFIGIEIEPKYFDIACRRIENAYNEGNLLRDVPTKSEKITLL